MPFILICATLGDRLAELKRLINSLENQDYNEWKLIIVHQGTRNRELLEQMSKSQRIEYINSSKKGLSLARNLALKLLERRHIDSDCIIGYPDDDCYFSKNTLSIVAEFLKKYNSADIKSGISLYDLLKRPEIKYEYLSEIDDEMPGLTEEEAEELEIQIKYEGYIKKQLVQVEQFKKLEGKRIPEDIDYKEIKGLSSEARQKLSEIRPVNIGQASRISGVSPADISVLMVYMEQLKRR